MEIRLIIEWQKSQHNFLGILGDSPFRWQFPRILRHDSPTNAAFDIYIKNEDH
jgi:hypothetical protein